MNQRVQRRTVSALHCRSSTGRFGPERVLLELEPALSQEGVETRLLALYRAPDDGPRIHPWIQEARAAGIPADQIADPAALSVTVLRRLARRIGGSGADILHTHDYRTNVLGGLAARRVDRSIPWVATVHLHTATSRRLRVYRALDLFLLRLADRVITVSRDQRRLLLRRGVDRQRLVLIPTVIDIDGFVRAAEGRDTVRERLGVSPDSPVVTLVGRLSAQKGVDVLLSAATVILEHLPETRFLIVGSGPLRATLEKQTDELGLTESVSFLGYLREIPSVLGASDVVVFPSRSEGLPVAMLEAMAMARPVVASCVGGIPDLVSHGRTGLLVERDGAEELAMHVVRVLGDPGMARSLGEAGRAKVAVDCCPQRAARRIASIYRSVLLERQ